jgi:hypothetical protein
MFAYARLKAILTTRRLRKKKSSGDKVFADGLTKKATFFLRQLLKPGQTAAADRLL